MVPFAGLLAALEQIPDPRRRQGQRYSLAPLLLFAVLAVLAGATSYYCCVTGHAKSLIQLPFLSRTSARIVERGQWVSPARDTAVVGRHPAAPVRLPVVVGLAGRLGPHRLEHPRTGRHQSGRYGGQSRAN